MVKVSSSDIVAILRRFDVANEDIVPRHIESIKISHPNSINTLASFKYQNTQLYILFDDDAEDNEGYIIDQIRGNDREINGTLHINPLEQSHTTYGLPFKGGDVYLFEVVADKKRIDLELSNRYPDKSRSTWQKHIEAGHIAVNGQIVTSSKFGVKESDSIAISIPEPEDFSSETLPILYVDDNVIVVNKPAGMLTHSKGALNDEFVVADFFKRYTDNSLADSNRAGVVHRLDRDTSGVIIGARNKDTAEKLQKQFSQRTAKKVYYAILDREPSKPKAVIDVPIARNPKAPSTFRADIKGKPALTKYEVISSNQNGTLVKFEPKTGRTHQLRVHASYLNAPIKGDRVYGKADERLYLHAASLEVTIPPSTRRQFSAPVPKEFKKLFPEVDSWEQ